MAEIWFTASPSDAPSLRLKLIVTAGNWLWWFTASGVIGTVLLCTSAESGTATPFAPFTYSMRSVLTSPSNLSGTPITTQ